MPSSGHLETLTPMTPKGTKRRTRRVRIRIREGTEDDLEEVVDLWEELVDHHREYSDYFTLARDGRKRWAEYLEQKFSEPSTMLLVAEEDDALVGFMLCLLGPVKPIFREKTVGIISDAYVVRHRRKKGIMNELMATALRWFKKNRIRSVEVSVSVANQEAREVWNLLGFKPFMERRRLSLKDEKAVALIEGRIDNPLKRTVRKTKRTQE